MHHYRGLPHGLNYAIGSLVVIPGCLLLISTPVKAEYQRIGFFRVIARRQVKDITARIAAHYNTARAALRCGRAAPYGLICAVIGFVLGLVKYRKVLQFNSLTVQRFKNTFKDSFNADKLNRYVDKMF